MNNDSLTNQERKSKYPSDYYQIDDPAFLSRKSVDWHMVDPAAGAGQQRLTFSKTAKDMNLKPRRSANNPE